MNRPGSASGDRLIHATSVAIDGRALLLLGPSASGKSDLALRLVDRGAQLVSDDYTLLENREGTLYACAVPEIAGQIEIRGIGIDDIAFRAEAPVALILRLDAVPDRLPAEELEMHELQGCNIPALPLLPFEASAAVKAERALRIFGLKVQPA